MHNSWITSSHAVPGDKDNEMTGLYEKLKIYEGLSHPRNDEKNWFILRFILRVGFIKETYIQIWIYMLTFCTEIFPQS